MKHLLALFGNVLLFFWLCFPYHLRCTLHAWWRWKRFLWRKKLEHLSFFPTPRRFPGWRNGTDHDMLLHCGGCCNSRLPPTARHLWKAKTVSAFWLPTFFVLERSITWKFGVFETFKTLSGPSEMCATLNLCKDQSWMGPKSNAALEQPRRRNQCAPLRPQSGEDGYQLLENAPNSCGLVLSKPQVELARKYYITGILSGIAAPGWYLAYMFYFHSYAGKSTEKDV